MPYFPKTSERAPYHCPGCCKWFVVPPVASSCCVQHPPGTCCHYGEIQVYGPAARVPDGLVGSVSRIVSNVSVR